MKSCSREGVEGTKLRATIVEQIDRFRKGRQTRELGDQLVYHFIVFIVFVRYFAILLKGLRLNLIGSLISRTGAQRQRLPRCRQKPTANF
jgi:hypothetical protein